MPNNDGFLSGKLFDYLGAKKPIYAIGPVGKDADEIIKHSNSGNMVDYSDVDGAYKMLTEFYTAWQNDSNIFTFDVERYSRIELAKTLGSTFDELLDLKK